MSEKKKIIIEIVLFIILLIGITVIYNYLTEQPKHASQNIIEEEKVEIMEIKNTEQFEQEVLNENGTVFVDFYARWCIPCRTMSTIIEEISKENKDVKFVKVDVDKNQELATKYNVMNIPTMLIIKNGEVTKTFIGIVDKESIVKEF